MQDLVKTALKFLGYTTSENDDALITFFIVKVTNEVKIEYNITQVTDEMENIIVDVVLGEFLQHKKTFMKDDLTGLDLIGLGEVSSISIGDTSTSYTSLNHKSDEQKLEEYINILLSKKSQLVRFRRVVW